LAVLSGLQLSFGLLEGDLRVGSRFVGEGDVIGWFAFNPGPVLQWKSILFSSILGIPILKVNIIALSSRTHHTSYL